VIVLVGACSLIGGAGQPEALAGRTFLSTAVTVDGGERPLVPGTQIRLTFGEDGQLGASAGCNSYGAPFRVDAGVLIADGGAMTEMGCDAPRHAQDDWLFEFLGARPTITFSNGELTLTVGTTTIRLLDREVAEPDLPLAGPLWVVDGFIDGETAMSAPGGPTASLQFAESGEFRLDAGCNQGTGTAIVGDDGSLRLGPIALTRRACQGPEAELERMVLTVLQADSLGWEIDASRLVLRHDGRAVTFRAG
jgi:heat shock protein HslJ